MLWTTWMQDGRYAVADGLALVVMPERVTEKILDYQPLHGGPA